MSSGVRTNSLPLAGGIRDVIVNSESGTSRHPFEDFSNYMAATGPLADRLNVTEAVGAVGGLRWINLTLEDLEARTEASIGEFGLVYSLADDGGIYERTSGGWDRVGSIPAILVMNEAAAAAVQAAIDAGVSEGHASTSEGNAAVSASSAIVAAGQAIAAAQLAGSPLHPDTATALAAVDEGAAFLVSDAGGLVSYTKTSGAAANAKRIGEVAFDDVAELLAFTGSLPVGLYLRTRKEGFSYQVVASGGDIVTAEGTELSVIPVLTGADGGMTTPLAWGIDVSGVADGAAQFQRMCRGGYEIYIPDGAIVDGGGASITLDKSVTIRGSGGESAGLIRNLTIEATGSFDGLYIEGVRFGHTATPSAASLPPAGVILRNVNRPHLSRCRFEDVRVVLGGNGTIALQSARVADCVFEADWSSWGWTTLQADILTVRGYQHVEISGNNFSAIDVTRFIKLSISTTAADPVSEYNDRGVFISRNAFTGSATGNAGKQMIDCYSGTVQLVYSENWVTALGWTDAIENKTGYTYDAADTVVSHKVINNYIDCNTRAVLYQGGYGATDWTPGSEYYDLTISGNTIVKHAASEATLDVRFMHALTVSNNVMKAADGVGAVYHVSASSCRSNIFIANIVEGGEFFVSKATSNAGGDSFISEPESIVFASNIVREYDLTAALTCKDLTALQSISITGNIVTTSLNTAVAAAFWVRSCTVERVTCTGNTSDHSAASSKNKLHCTYSTIADCRESGNSWHPPMKTLANSATPSLKSVSTGSSIAGGDLYLTGGSTAITNLTDGYEGQIVTIYFNQSVTVTNGSTMRLSGGADFAGTLYDTLTLRNVGGVWIEVGRSVN